MEASCQGSSKPIGQQQHGEEDEEINICVKMIETLSLQISKFETVGELKALVYEQEGKPELHQQLFFKGNHLRNDKTRLFDYGIRSNNTVIAYVGNSKNIKALIEDSENVGSDEYSLVYGGKVLEEEKILALLGITNRSRLYVVLNPKDVIQVSVKMLNRESVKTQVRLLHTILDVRSFVGSVVVNSVVGALSYGGKKLDDSKTVSYYNIEDGSVLEELPRLSFVQKLLCSRRSVVLFQGFVSKALAMEEMYMELCAVKKCVSQFPSMVFAANIFIAQSSDLKGEEFKRQVFAIQLVSVCVGSTSIRTFSMEASCPRSSNPMAQQELEESSNPMAQQELEESSNPMAQQEQEEEDEVINICVKIVKTMSLQISKFETVGELKTLVYEKGGIPELHQELFCKGNHLKNEKTRLFDYGIRSNTNVSAYIGNSEMLSLIIEIPSRKTTFDVESKPQDTVQSVKDVIAETENMGSDEFNLVYRGRVLEGEKTLAFVGVLNESSLYVVLNPRVLQVSVKMACGETVKIEAREFYTILDVRSLVESIVGHSVGVLSYGGRKLQDSKTVSYYQIKDESILEVLPSNPSGKRRRGS
nr:polyubiquitin-like isoform X2 [Ipomoea batatas]